MNYDRLYDMARFHPSIDGSESGYAVRVNAFYYNYFQADMREGGLEPPSLSAPDPKSESRDFRPSDAPRSALTDATERHAAPPSASPTTTNRTTRRTEGNARALRGHSETPLSSSRRWLDAAGGARVESFSSDPVSRVSGPRPALSGLSCDQERAR